MWRMKVSASIQNSSRSPCSIHSARSTWRSKRTCSVSVGVKAVKSWGPGRRRRARVQGVAVEAVAPPQRAPALERVARAPVQEPVAVGAREGVAPRVEAVRGRGAVEHRDRRREQGVQAHRVERLVLVGRDLAPGVHAGVGAPGDGQPSRPAEDPAERRLDLALDRALARLDGPAGERAAVVLEKRASRSRRRCAGGVLEPVVAPVQLVADGDRGHAGDAAAKRLVGRRAQALP